MSLASTVLKLSQKWEDVFIIKQWVVKNLAYVKHKSHTISWKLRLSVELPLDDEKFASLHEKDLKIWDLPNKVINGMYKEFYIVKGNVLFRSIVENG